MSMIELLFAVFFHFYCIPLTIIELLEVQWAHMGALTIVNDGAARNGHDGHGASFFLNFVINNS